jgi:hypothetical protein
MMALNGLNRPTAPAAALPCTAPPQPSPVCKAGALEVVVGDDIGKGAGIASGLWRLARPLDPVRVAAEADSTGGARALREPHTSASQSSCGKSSPAADGGQAARPGWRAHPGPS